MNEKSAAFACAGGATLPGSSSVREKQVEQLAINFEMRTGVDLRAYRRTEITDTISDLLRFPLYAAKFVALPLGIALGVTVLLAILGKGWVETTVLALAAPVIAVVLALTSAAVFFIFKLKTDVTQALCLGLDLSREVADDVREIQARHQEKRLSPPSFGELVTGVMHVVIIPVTRSTLRRKIPVLGLIFGNLVGRLAGQSTRRLVRKIEAEHPELEARPKAGNGDGDRTWILKRLDELSELAESTKKVASVTIDWSSRILVIPAALIWAFSILASLLFYGLVFRYL